MHEMNVPLSYQQNYCGIGTFSGLSFVPQLVLAIPFVLLWIIYVFAAVRASLRDRGWPLHRSVCWTTGILAAIFSVAGPLAQSAHSNFSAHMVGHLLLGMLAPLLMALAAPMTLLLRTISIPAARSLSKILKSRPLTLYVHPLTASFLNIGGLWVLYTTDLYQLLHKSILLHVLVHFHLFAAAYLFTVSMLYIDPMPHRVPFLYRSTVLVMALGGHGILSKYIYAHPPAGIPLVEAELAGMIMYYGGDTIDIVIILIICLKWYKAVRPRGQLAESRANMD